MGTEWVLDLHESNAEEALAILEVVWPQLDVPGRAVAHIAPYPARSDEFAGFEEEDQERRFRWDVVLILKDKGVLTSARRVELEEYDRREAIEVRGERDRVVEAIAALKSRLRPQGRAAPPELPNKLTLAWMWSHVPARWWWSAILVLAVLVSMAYWAGRSRLVGRVVDVVVETFRPVEHAKPKGMMAGDSAESARPDSAGGMNQ